MILLKIYCFIHILFMMKSNVIEFHKCYEKFKIFYLNNNFSLQFCKYFIKYYNFF